MDVFHLIDYFLGGLHKRKKEGRKGKKEGEKKERRSTLWNERRFLEIQGGPTPPLRRRLTPFSKANLVSKVSPGATFWGGPHAPSPPPQTPLLRARTCSLTLHACTHVQCFALHVPTPGRSPPAIMHERKSFSAHFSLSYAKKTTCTVRVRIFISREALQRTLGSLKVGPWGAPKTSFWVASPVAVSPALPFPTIPYHAIFSSFCPLWSLVLQPTSPQQPKRLIERLCFFPCSTTFIR